MYSNDNEQLQYSFQQKDEEFLQGHRQKAIGKILSKYERSQYLNSPSKASGSRVHHGMVLNYSQIYQDIRLPQFSSSREFGNGNDYNVSSAAELKGEKYGMIKSGLHGKKSEEVRAENDTGIIVNSPNRSFKSKVINSSSVEIRNKNKEIGQVDEEVQTPSQYDYEQEVASQEEERAIPQHNEDYTTRYLIEDKTTPAYKSPTINNKSQQIPETHTIGDSQQMQQKLEKISASPKRQQLQEPNIIVHYQQNCQREIFEESGGLDGDQFIAQTAHQERQPNRKQSMPKSSHSKLRNPNPEHLRIADPISNNQLDISHVSKNQLNSSMVSRHSHSQIEGIPATHQHNHSRVESKDTLNQLAEELNGSRNDQVKVQQGEKSYRSKDVQRHRQHPHMYEEETGKQIKDSQHFEEQLFAAEAERDKLNGYNSQSQSQENPERNEQGYNPSDTIKQSQQDDVVKTFNLEIYTKIYPILRSMQAALKSQIIDAQSLVRGVKHYLQLIASGFLDNFDQFDLQLHKKKIVKTALLYERVAIVVIAFCYANHSLKESHKYLLNLLSYALGTSLLMVKVLESSQITNPRNSRNQVARRSDRLMLKKSMDTVRNNNDVLIDSIYKLSKYDSLFYENLKQIVKLLHRSSLAQTFYSILEYFAFFLCVSDLHNMLPFLAITPDPYLPPCLTHRYTLVIDIVEVCCAGTKKARHHTFRPYAEHFLAEMSNYFEIVAFTNSLPNHIDKLIGLLDPKGHIKHRLYKHHGLHKMGGWVKDLQRLGRPVSRVILLDNESLAGPESKDNLIHVPQWRGSRNDTILAELCPVMAMIAIKQIDARVAAQKIREQTHKNELQGVKYVNFGISFE